MASSPSTLFRYLALPLTAVIGAWLIGGPLARGWAAVASLLVLLGTQCLGALLRARREPEARAAWLGIFAFGLLGLFNAGVFARNLIVHGAALPHPPLSTLVAWVPALGFLMLALAKAPPPRQWNPSEILEGAIFSVAAFLALWMWVIKPMCAGLNLPLGVTLGIHAVFGTVCAALGLALHTWLERGDALVTPVGLLTLGLAAIAGLLPWWVGTLLNASFHVGHPVRLCMAGGFLPLALAPWASWRLEEARPRRALALALPYVPTVLAFVGFIAHDLAHHTQQDPLGLVLLGGLALLVLARQALTLRQLFRLNRTLEAKVETRTRDLARSQALLMETQQRNLVATLGAGLTHDINNLLGAALGNLDLLRIRGIMEVDPEALAGLEGALERAGGLSRRLMALAREGAGPSRTFDLTAHVEELRPLLRALVPKNIDLDWAAEPAPLNVHGNPGQVDQVLVNLVSNAKDATPSGGRISVRARPEGTDAVLEVADTGSGIPDEVMQRLFEPFLTTKAPGKGTGLGLSSVRAVVEHMGGRIEVRSALKEGTTFTIRLPKVSQGA